MSSRITRSMSGSLTQARRATTTSAITRPIVHVASGRTIRNSTTRSTTTTSNNTRKVTTTFKISKNAGGGRGARSTGQGGASMLKQKRKTKRSESAKDDEETSTATPGASVLSPEVNDTVSQVLGVSVPKPLPPDLSYTIPTTTVLTMTQDLLQQGHAHIRNIEPKLGPLIDAYDWTRFSGGGRPKEVVNCFESLASGIVSQQVSGAAAKSIKRKFISLFYPDIQTEINDTSSSASSSSSPPPRPPPFPTPAMVLSKDISTLRTAGLSQRKAEYMHSLAEGFQNGTLTPSILYEASDEEIIKRLTSIRGIGVWSAEMFLIFHLHRTDIFSLGDLGIQRGMAVFMGKDVTKLRGGGKKPDGGNSKWKYMSQEEMIKISERFRPYRSLFCLLMWRMSDTSVESLGNRGQGGGEGAAKKKK